MCPSAPFGWKDLPNTSTPVDSVNLAAGASFAATGKGPALPATTVISTLLTVWFRRNAANTVWSCVGVA